MVTIVHQLNSIVLLPRPCLRLNIPCLIIVWAHYYCGSISGWIFKKVIDSYKSAVPSTPLPKLSSLKLL